MPRDQLPENITAASDRRNAPLESRIHDLLSRPDYDVPTGLPARRSLVGLLDSFEKG
ncbi:MAG: hypothetical protein K0S37_3094, partial [Microbacterium sp.]|nr:hypothetical protein [Microbacterium sp.]